MKTLILFVLTGSLFFNACYVPGMSGSDSSFKSSDKEYSFIQEYTISSPLSLNLSTSGGNINTVARDGNGVEVAFIVKKRNQVVDISLEELKKLADVEIIQNGNSLTINIKHIHERNLSVGFSVKTPANTSCNLNTSGGNISLTDVNGSQNVNTSGGNIDLTKLTGTVTANTSGGNISISDSKATYIATTSGGNISLNNIDGKLKVSTSGGNIHANNVKPELNAETSGGNIDVNNAEGPLDVNTSGGSITLDKIAGSVKAETSGGSISANITKLSDKLDLETSGGGIRVTIPSGLGLNLDLSADHIDTQLTNFSGTAKKDRINGQINGGGIPVHISTSGGSITLSYR